MGDGPLFLEDAEGNATTDINPAAVGVRLKNADFLVHEFGSGENATYAMLASGQVEIIGVPGVTFSGFAQVRLNTTDANQTLSIVTDADNIDNNGDLTVDEAGEISEVELLPGQIEITGSLDLVVEGQTFSGDFSFGKTGDTITVGFNNVEVDLAGGALSLDSGNGTFILDPQGLAGVMNANAVSMSQETSQSRSADTSHGSNVNERSLDEDGISLLSGGEQTDI